MISQKIQQIIDEVKSEKNSEERNRIVSHLKDAQAHAVAREKKYQDAPHPADQCICPEGAQATDCPVHS
jgi:hypothetical protein